MLVRGTPDQLDALLVRARVRKALVFRTGPGEALFRRDVLAALTASGQPTPLRFSDLEASGAGS